ncbi:MAG: methyltransferase domain-containing protein, partial [Alphaproteobacteria bacterium]
MAAPPKIFDRVLLRQRLKRAAARLGDHDFLLREVAGRMAERLQDVPRTFKAVLAIGGPLTELAALYPDAAITRAARWAAPDASLVLDEETLPFKPHSFDLVAVLGGLHWVNDLPGCLVQIRRILRPDGLFLGALAGGTTLYELRQAFLEADSLNTGGVSPRVAPFADVRDLGDLLQRAGFAMP